jgi:hypothetical protein
MFNVEVFNRDGAALVLGPDLLLAPQPWTFAAAGGPKAAEIRASGDRSALKDILLNWLDYRVLVTSPSGGPCWWGYVHEIALTLDGLEITASLEGLRNRVAVTYTALEGGAEKALTTAWAEDAASQSQYGVCEFVDTLGQATTAMATAYRDRLLSEGAWPQLGRALAAGGEMGAVLRCRGYLTRAARRYYQRTDGRLEHQDGESKIQPVGWGVTASNQVGFGDGGIHDAWGRLADMAEGMKLTVTGSLSNNKTFTVLDASGEEVESYSNNTIYFQPSDDIFDSVAGMGVFKSEHWLLVSGSAANSRWHRVGSAGADHLRTSASVSGAIVSEATGPTIGMYQAQRMSVAESTAYEAPGSANVTIAHQGQQVAQRFQPLTAMKIDRVLVDAAKVGAPTDNLEVRILADSAGAPGSLLASGSVAAADLPADDLTATWVTLGAAVQLTAGTYYWIHVRRSGALDGQNYYRLGMTDAAYLTCRMWTGSAWVAHAPGWFVRFRLWATEDTGTLAEALLTEVMGAPVTVQTGFLSGVGGFPTMDARAVAADELERLLQVGAASGRRVLIDATPDLVLRLYEQPAPDVTAMPQLRTAGGKARLFDVAGSPWPPEVSPAGLWAELGDIDIDLLAVGGLSPAFIDEATYDPQADSWDVALGKKRGLAEMLKVQAG